MKDLNIVLYVTYTLGCTRYTHLIQIVVAHAPCMLNASDRAIRPCPGPCLFPCPSSGAVDTYPRQNVRYFLEEIAR